MNMAKYNLTILLITSFIILVLVPVYANAEMTEDNTRNAEGNIDTENANLADNSDITSISNIIANPSNFANNKVMVTGRVVEVLKTKTETLPIIYTLYINLDDGTGSIWAVIQAEEPITISEASELSVKGFLLAGFRSSYISRTFDLVILSKPDELNEIEAPPIQTKRLWNIILDWFRSIIGI